MRRRRWMILGAVVAAIVAGGIVTVVDRGGGYAVRTQQLWVAGTPEPTGTVSGSGHRTGSGSTSVALDATLYLPEGAPREPAVLLAHGFGGSKDDVAAQARRIAARGYVVLAWTARGFGRSGGDIHLDSPSYEVADARRLIDLLATRPEVLLDGPGDPRVAVVGASYGGGLGLMLAAYDHRVDAVISQITWNDLRHSLFPQSQVVPTAATSPAGMTPVSTPGVFKKAWAGDFFSPSGQGSAASVGSASDAGCGRFAPELCEDYEVAATTGRPTARMLETLAASSPATVLDRITAPTLLIQGEADSLFPLSEADANAAGIAAHGTPVHVIWYSGGHDGGAGTADETSRLTAASDAWLDRYLRHRGSTGTHGFEVTVPSVEVSSENGRATSATRWATAEPGLPGTGTAGTRTAAGSGTALPARRVALAGAAQVVQAPAGGSPAAVTDVPGLGSLLAAAGSAGGLGLSALPGQVARFTSAPLAKGVALVGSSRVTVHVAAAGPAGGDATLFAQLYDIAPDGTAVLPNQLVAPIYLAALTTDGEDVTIATPAVVRDVAAGHRLSLVISTTDQAYALPDLPRRYRVGPPTGAGGEATLSVPVITLTADTTGGAQGLWPWAVALVVAAAGVLLVRRTVTRGRRAETPQDELAGVPLAIEGLGKAYGDGFRAVTDLTFRVEAGWVLGLLGPNGAGKTTTLRMLMGLIRPSEGGIRVFGHAVSPGAAVLSRVGSFVEGPGFLPHVTGLDNLRLYWEATGRPRDDAHLAEALEIAGLGDDVHRTVKTYSQGMRQRLAIAQAMLGLPDLLVLDEPTNGLDPPQIREMREVLARYATTGRTVVVSSHLLAEVEQTCTHVVVMHHGRLIAQGPVAELVGAATGLAVDVDDPVRGAQIAAGVSGADRIRRTATGFTLSLVGTPRAELVRALVGAGVGVDRVGPQRGLEQAFLALVEEGES